MTRRQNIDLALLDLRRYFDFVNLTDPDDDPWVMLNRLNHLIMAAQKVQQVIQVPREAYYSANPTVSVERPPEPTV